MKFVISGYYFEITSLCNARCFYCYNNSGYEKHKSIEISLIEKIIREDESISNKEIIISGGEPFLHKDIIKIISLINSKQIRCKIITNGTCLNKETLKLLKGMKITLQFSLNGLVSKTHDSITTIRGSYKTICTAIKYIKANMPYIKTQIRYLIQRSNVNEIEDIKNSYLYQLADEVILDILKFSGRESSDNHYFFDINELFQVYHRIDELKNEMSKISIPKLISICKFCENSDNIHIYPRIDCFGYVYPCNLFCGNEYQIGNNESIPHMLNNNTMKNFLAICSARKSNIENCSSCFAKEVCYGGCPGLSDICGNFYHEDVYCNLRKEYFLNKLRSAITR